MDDYRIYCAGCGVEITKLRGADFCPECEQEFTHPAFSTPAKRESFAKSVWDRTLEIHDEIKAGTFTTRSSLDFYKLIER